jgi:hypothetical protein
MNGRRQVSPDPHALTRSPSDPLLFPSFWLATEHFSCHNHIPSCSPPTPFGVVERPLIWCCILCVLVCLCAVCCIASEAAVAVFAMRSASYGSSRWRAPAPLALMIVACVACATLTSACTQHSSSPCPFDT